MQALVDEVYIEKVLFELIRSGGARTSRKMLDYLNSLHSLRETPVIPEILNRVLQRLHINRKIRYISPRWEARKT